MSKRFRINSVIPDRDAPSGLSVPILRVFTICRHLILEATIDESKKVSMVKVEGCGVLVTQKQDCLHLSSENKWFYYS